MEKSGGKSQHCKEKRSLLGHRLELRGRGLLLLLTSLLGPFDLLNSVHGYF